MFFDKNTQDKKTPTPEGYHALAGLLACEIAKRGKLQRPVSKAEWARHLAKLETIDGVPAARVEEVVQWYVSNMGKPFVPVALSGRGFRKKWVSILSAVERATKDIPTAEAVSPAAKAVAAKHAHLVWPDGASADVGGFLQAVLSGYARWRGRVRAVHDSIRKKYRLRPDQSYALLPSGKDRTLLCAAGEALSGLKDPEGFASDLLKEEHRIATHFGQCKLSARVRKWEEDLNRKGFTLMAKYGNPQLWDRLCEEVKRGNE